MAKRLRRDLMATPGKAVDTAGQALDLHPAVHCSRWAVRLDHFRHNVATI